MLNGRVCRKNTTRIASKPSNKTTINGPSFEFRWSTAVHSRALKSIDKTSTPLRSLCTDRYQQNSPSTNSRSLDRASSVSSSLSTQKSLRRLVHSTKNRQITVTKPNISYISLHPLNDRCSTPFLPLILNYSQLRRTNQSEEKKRLSQSQMAIDKLSTVSVATSKLSLSSNSFITSAVLPPLVQQVPLPTNNLVRLRTPQLRVLNIRKST